MERKDDGFAVLCPELDVASQVHRLAIDGDFHTGIPAALACSFHR
jgi:hypothetical protein